MSRTTVVSRRRCSLCKVLTRIDRLVRIEWEWASDLSQEQLLCPVCVYAVPAEVLELVPHTWRPVVAA